MDHKYKLTDEIKYIGDVKLHRIRATEDNAHVPAGTLGGWIEKPWNLWGDAWVTDEGCVYGNAVVCDNALISGHAQVYENARVYSNAIVTDYSKVFGNASLSSGVKVYDNASVSGDTYAYINASIYGNAKVHGYVILTGNAHICGNAEAYSNHSRKRIVLFGTSLSGDERKIFIASNNDTEPDEQINKQNDDEMEEDDE